MNYKLLILGLAFAILLSGCTLIPDENKDLLKQETDTSNSQFVKLSAVPTFETCSEIGDEFAKTRIARFGGGMEDMVFRNFGAPTMAAAESQDSATTGNELAANKSGTDFSTTNVQVEGVDEADFVKTDGEYIYIVSRNKFIIAKAHPTEDAKVLSTIELEEFRANEMFINEDKVLLFGNTSKQFPNPYPKPEPRPLPEPYPLPVEKINESGEEDVPSNKPQEEIEEDSESFESSSGSSGTTNSVEATSAPMPERDLVAIESKMIAPNYYPYYPDTIYKSFTTIQVYDVSDKSSPEIIRAVDFEGNYLTGRMIGTHAYFVMQSYPEYYPYNLEGVKTDENYFDEDMLPIMRDRKGLRAGEDDGIGYRPIGGCNDIGFLPPVENRQFVTVASIDLANPEGEIEKETVLASGYNVYASESNLYFAGTSYRWTEFPGLAKIVGGVNLEETIVHKFSLDNGKIEYQGNGLAPGHILNQFSMDEYNGYFRIATTYGNSWNRELGSTNNVYVMDSGMEVVGKLEGLAPGESIFSTRFLGERVYMVTFKKVDPLFVIDLSEPENPTLLGKLKIPGFSDYLHPLDETHLIGVGKDAIAAVDSKTGKAQNFAWYQGMKIAVFDVTDVENPKEQFVVVIGDRGTDSYALRDHRAFLFDKERELLVVPVRLAEITAEQIATTKPEYRQSMWGEYKYQGAYVYNLNLQDGFSLKGRITHYEDNAFNEENRFYFYGSGNDIKRTLYIDDVLYTISDFKIKANNLDDLSELKELVIVEDDEPIYPYYEGDFEGLVQ